MIDQNKLKFFTSARKISRTTLSHFSRMRNWNKRRLMVFLGQVKDLIHTEAISPKEAAQLTHVHSKLVEIVENWEKESSKYGIKNHKFKTIQEANSYYNTNPKDYTEENNGNFY